jgi:hypothetical protein
MSQLPGEIWFTVIYSCPIQVKPNREVASFNISCVASAGPSSEKLISLDRLNVEKRVSNQERIVF